MASEIIYTCDRCGTEVKHTDIYSIVSGYAHINVDVCKNCLNKLKKFLKGEDV